MTDSGPVRPRRAMDPLPETVEAMHETGSRSLPFDPDWDSGEAETQVLRRAIMPTAPDSPASPASPADSVSRAWASTPVPPPAAVPPKPVLPEPTAALQASAGRRFSASASPSEISGSAPRRSATSVSSPPSAAAEPAAPPAVSFQPARPYATTPPVEPPAPPVEPPATDVPPAPRRARRALGVLGIVLAIAAVVTGAVFLVNPPKETATTTAPPVATTPTPSTSLDPLLTADDLTTLSATTWSPGEAPAGAAAANPICLPEDAASMPVPDRTSRRLLTSASNPKELVAHVVETYPDTASATEAYQARLLQAGTCENTDALIVDSSTVSGLADSAFAAQVDAQDDPLQHHGLLVSRTGRNLSMIDVTSSEPVDLKAVAAAAAEPLARLCSGGEGACPGAVALSASIPAASQYPGWLIEADLPRITPGAGRWGHTEPSPTLTIMGSQCEAVGLVKVKDAAQSAQRTLLLADDPVVPAGFGIDQVVYTFAGEKPAKTFADKVTKNIAGCADRVPTASVKKGPSTKGTGADGAGFTGKSYLVTQKTANDSVQYRVGVVRVGDRVAYLLANPSDGVDFSDQQWQAIMKRTGERVSQTP